MIVVNKKNFWGDVQRLLRYIIPLICAVLLGYLFFYWYNGCREVVFQNFGDYNSYLSSASTDYTGIVYQSGMIIPKAGS